MKRSTMRCAEVVVEPLEVNAPLEGAVVSFGSATCPAILESSLAHPRHGRFSIFACEPVQVYTSRRAGVDGPFAALAAVMGRYPAVEASIDPLPFPCGWIGFVSYEAALASERIESRPIRSSAIPHVRFCLYDAAAIFDHQTAQWSVIAVDWPAPLARHRPPVGKRLAALRDRLTSATRAGLPRLPEPACAFTRPTAPESNLSLEAYLARVERAKRYIEAGDIYQVNLTQRFTTRTAYSPLSLYRRLRRENPSSHAALLQWDGVAVLSSSPELFLDLRQGQVITRPIKGTRPRTGNPATDRLARSALVRSGKDRSELNMIIDLLRNDLGRVCSFGSVRVTDAGTIEAHPTVFHRTATIEGTLRASCDWEDLCRAAFPGGSVTGAPKIRAMQIIAELEPTPRDVYCGSIGWIGLDGSMSMNIAIRTMVQRGERVQLYAGGAIVAESRPEEEHEECLAKAEGMLRALQSAPPGRKSRRKMVTSA